VKNNVLDHWQHTSELPHSFYEAKIAEEILSPSLPLIAKEILSSLLSRHQIDTHLITICLAPLSCHHITSHYHHRVWFNLCIFI
jgi:hypothetical protein